MSEFITLRVKSYVNSLVDKEKIKANDIRLHAFKNHIQDQIHTLAGRVLPTDTILLSELH